MVQRSGNSGAARQIDFIKNNYFHDAFFLKALGALFAAKLERRTDGNLQS